MSCHDLDHMEMPTPCSRCGEWNELNDYRSMPGRTDLVCDDCDDSQAADDPEEARGDG